MRSTSGRGATIEAKKEADEIVEGPVIEVVKGGLIVDIGLRGFLPASLVELRRVRDLAPYIGTTVQAKIIELDKNRNNVVLSRRAYLEENQKETRDSFLTNLKIGEVREGTVSSVVSFGAFVDLGGMDGLIHVSELSWKHVDHPGSVVAVGDPVKVQVLDVDFSRERISLSLKATQADPWQEFAETHEVGQLVYGRVTKLVQFGAFVQVGDGIEGLVHISEMSTHHVESPEQVVTPGEELWVKIIDLDLARRRISLSIKQAAEGGELAAEYREHFEIDDEGNWATQQRRGRGRLGRVSERRCRRRGAAPAADGPAAELPPSAMLRLPRPLPAEVQPGGGCAARPKQAPMSDAEVRVDADRRGLIADAPGRSDRGNRRRQVDGVVAARGARRRDRRRRPDRPRPPGARSRRCSTGWPSGSATHIIRDDGSLDRAAVAAIVFGESDDAKQALAGSERHRPPGDAGRDRTADRGTGRHRSRSSCSTSRCSARTRATTSPPRSSSTCRSTSRSNDSSSSAGMDEDDARNRIASQISRDERLATATHVVDNSGDLDQLRVEVDGLWGAARRPARRRGASGFALTRRLAGRGALRPRRRRRSAGRYEAETIRRTGRRARDVGEPS